jgi:phosphate transport system substrate-binding protein
VVMMLRGFPICHPDRVEGLCVFWVTQAITGVSSLLSIRCVIWARYLMSRRKLVLNFLILVLLGLNANAQQQFEITGSDMLLSLGSQLTQVYQKRFPQMVIMVKGGADAAEVKNADHRAIVQSHGTLVAPARYVFPVAIEAITIYVNETNPVRTLTISQLRGIFRGDIINWKDLGGPDRRIHPYGADNTTGLQSFFTQAVLKGEESDNYEGKANTKAMLDAMSDDPAAIGFGIYDLAPGVSIVALKAGPASDSVLPSIQNFRSRTYPLTRQIFWAVPRNASPSVKSFCAWVLSREGQLVVEAAGFQPLLPGERESNIALLTQPKQ